MVSSRRIRLSGRRSHDTIRNPRVTMSRRLARMTSGLYLPGLSRRSFIRGAGLSAAALSGSSLLAACGTEGAQVEEGSCTSTDLSAEEKTIVFSNWIGYVDPVKAKDTSTLEKFQQ